MSVLYGLSCVGSMQMYFKIAPIYYIGISFFQPQLLIHIFIVCTCVRLYIRLIFEQYRFLIHVIFKITGNSLLQRDCCTRRIKYLWWWWFVHVESDPKLNFFGIFDLWIQGVSVTVYCKVEMMYNAVTMANEWILHVGSHKQNNEFVAVHHD